jgi:hypothetical protein
LARSKFNVRASVDQRPPGSLRYYTTELDRFAWQNEFSVVIEPGASPIHARMRTALASLDEGIFTEGHELDRKWQVPKAMIGRRLSQAEAKRLLAKLR